MKIDRVLDLRRTLRPLGLAWSRFDADGWWRSARTPEGPVAINIRRTEDEVVGTSWGSGASWVLDRLDRLVGFDDPCESFSTDHPLISQLSRRRPGLRFGSTGLVFEAVLHGILGQKVTGKEAAIGLRGLTTRFSETAPGPAGISLPPDPARLADQPYHAFHELGIEKKRADTLIRVARRAARLELLAEETPAEAARVLVAFPGVGMWTAAETVVVSHGDADAVSVGDFHLKHIVSWNLAGEDRGTDARMLELLEDFRPHRGRVVRLLETGGEPYPRYGPRKPVRSFAGM